MRTNEILFTNYDLDRYEEEVRENRIEDNNEMDLTNEEVYEEASVIAEAEWEDIYFPALKKAFDEKKCLMHGVIGRWDGWHTGWSVGYFTELFNKALEDCGFWELGYDEDGQLYIKCSHHDGTNLYYFRALTRLGEDVYGEFEFGTEYENRTDNEVLEILIGSNFSEVPQISEWE